MKPLLLQVQDTSLAVHPGMDRCQERGARPCEPLEHAQGLSAFPVGQHERTGVHKVTLAKPMLASHSSCFSSALTIWSAQLFSWLLRATSTPLASTAGSIIKAIMLESVHHIPVYAPITHLLLYSGREMEEKGKNSTR